MLFNLMMAPGQEDSDAGNVDKLKWRLEGPPLSKKGDGSIREKNLGTEIAHLQ